MVYARILLGIWLCCVLTATAQAHQLKSAISTILFNPRTGNIEVSHRFYLHDAEHAVRAIFGHHADILGSPKTQRQFSDYVSERFTLFDDQQRPMPLQRVGYELEGRFFWVYQETAEPTTLHSMTVRNDALRDLWPSQVNTINIEGNGTLQTLVFDNTVELLRVDFSEHAQKTRNEKPL